MLYQCPHECTKCRKGPLLQTKVSSVNKSSSILALSQAASSGGSSYSCPPAAKDSLKSLATTYVCTFAKDGRRREAMEPPPLTV